MEKFPREPRWPVRLPKSTGKSMPTLDLREGCPDQKASSFAGSTKRRNSPRPLRKPPVSHEPKLLDMPIRTQPRHTHVKIPGIFLPFQGGMIPVLKKNESMVQTSRNASSACRLHKAVKNLYKVCLTHGVEVTRLIQDKGVIQISIRAIAHAEQFEKVLEDLLTVEKIKFKKIALPESVDLSKNKRRFLMFMKLVNESDEAKLRARLEKTGINFKIKTIDVAESQSDCPSEIE